MLKRKLLILCLMGLFLEPSINAAIKEKKKKDTFARMAKKQAKKDKKQAKGKKAPKKEKPKGEKTGKVTPSGGSELIQSIRDKIDQSDKDADVKLVDLVGDFLSKLPIPTVLASFFDDKIAFRDIKIVEGLPNSKYIRSGIGFTGSLFLNNVQVNGTMYVVIDTEFRPQYMFFLEMPNEYKISSLFPKLRKMDMFSLPKPRYILTTIEYTEPDGTARLPGFYFDAELNLSGPLDILRELKEKAKNFDFIVVRDEPIHISASIPVRFTTSGPSSWIVFIATIPIRFGIDFKKIEEVPSSVSDVFKEFTTDDFELKVVIPLTKPTQIEITLEAGVRITLGTQKEPLRLTNIAVLNPLAKRFGFGTRLRNMIELKLFALGNAGYQINWDLDVLKQLWSAGIPMPFSGLGYYGQIDVKEGKSRSTFKFASSVELTDDKIPSLLAHLEATNLKFDDLLALLISMAKRTKVFKKAFPVDMTPTFRINKFKGYFATEDAMIAKKFYKAGFGFTFDAQLFDQKVLYDVNIAHKELKMSGIGYLSDINIDVKGKKIFSLTGPGLDQKAGTKDDGPVAFCDFDAFHPGAAMFGVRGKIEIPPMKLEAETDLVMHGTSFKAKMKAQLAGFTGLFNVNINPLKPKEMFVEIGFDRDLDQSLLKELKNALTILKKGTQKKLNDANKKVNELSDKVSGFAKKGVKTIDQKIEDVKSDIAKIDKKIKKLKKERSDIPKIRVAKRATVTAKIAAQKLKRITKKGTLNLLLSPAKKAVESSEKLLDEATEKLTSAKVLQRSLDGIMSSITRTIDRVTQGAKVIRIVSASGSYSAKDMSEGKLPRISFVIQTNFPGMPSKKLSMDVQLDFDNPAKLIANMVQPILKAVGLKK